jgi:hypothetical protein
MLLTREKLVQERRQDIIPCGLLAKLTLLVKGVSNTALLKVVKQRTDVGVAVPKRFFGAMVIVYSVHSCSPVKVAVVLVPGTKGNGLPEGVIVKL